MEGLLSEADSIISDTEKGTAIRDAGLILAAQKAKHYEIATYGTLTALADAMEEPKIAKTAALDSPQRKGFRQGTYRTRSRVGKTNMPQKNNITQASVTAQIPGEPSRRGIYAVCKPLHCPTTIINNQYIKQLWT